MDPIDLLVRGCRLIAHDVGDSLVLEGGLLRYHSYWIHTHHTLINPTQVELLLSLCDKLIEFIGKEVPCLYLFWYIGLDDPLLSPNVTTEVLPCLLAGLVGHVAG